MDERAAYTLAVSRISAAHSSLQEAEYMLDAAKSALDCIGKIDLTPATPDQALHNFVKEMDERAEPLRQLEAQVKSAIHAANALTVYYDVLAHTAPEGSAHNG